MHKFKLKKDGTVVGYLEFKNGAFIYSNEDGSYISPYCISIEKGKVFSFSPPFYGSYYEHDECEYDSLHPFVCLDKNGDEVYAGDKVVLWCIKGAKGTYPIRWNDEDYSWWVGHFLPVGRIADHFDKGKEFELVKD